MPRSGRRALQTTALLVLALVAAVALLPLLGGPALLLPAAGWVALAMAGFILLQLVLFRLFGLSSRADEEPDEPEEPRDPPDATTGRGQGEDRDWRAWRG
jgi:hypothetical protein